MLTGNLKAAKADATTAQIITTQPKDSIFKTGVYLKIQLITAEIITVISIGVTFFAGGIIIAKNIPYIAMPKALYSDCGKSDAAVAPKSVERHQLRYAGIMSPAKYGEETLPSL